MKNRLIFIVFLVIFSIAVFNFVIKKQALKLFCLRKIHIQIGNFRSAAFQIGVVHIEEEEKYINLIKNDLYKQCLKEQK